MRPVQRTCRRKTLGSWIVREGRKHGLRRVNMVRAKVLPWLGHAGGVTLAPVWWDATERDGCFARVQEAGCVSMRGWAFGPRRPQGCVRSVVMRVAAAKVPAITMAIAVTALGIAACSRSAPTSHGAVSRPSVDPKTGTSPSQRIVEDGRPIPRGGGVYKVGTPYQISGRWYTPQEEPSYDRAGVASWYGDDFHGRKTANGEIYDMRALTAAHPTLPMPSYVWVTNLDNGRTLLVRVNDRGPYAHDRLIDLSRATARLLSFEGKGLSRVRVRYAGPAPLNGDDRREQTFARSQPWYGMGEPAIAQRRSPMIRPMAAGASPSRW